ncbi:hypothetical protein [Butyrivibrio sp. MC2013]|uniref:hypothetical protein n=1 Tax=Butyrivibrio sp. MC2013 TaxID=1280686 RepID=UPI00040007D4|nr:hypothetical protein [Butyrivibrio sp. MC2013]
MSDSQNINAEENENAAEDPNGHRHMNLDETKVEYLIKCIRRNENAESKKDMVKVNYKILLNPKLRLVRPFMVLFGTAVVAIVTYFRRFPVGRWIVCVCATLVLFLLLGTIMEYLLESYMLQIIRKEIDKRLEEIKEKERLEEEERIRLAREEFEAATNQ